MTASRSGVSRRSPSGTVKTTLAWPPEASGSSSATRSSTVWASVPSIFISELTLTPLIAMPPTTTARTATQPATNSQGLPNAVRPSRYKKVDMGLVLLEGEAAAL